MDAHFGFTSDSPEKALDSVEKPFDSTELDLGGLSDEEYKRRLSGLDDEELKGLLDKLGKISNDCEPKRLLGGLGEDGNRGACSIDPFDLRPKFVVVEKENLEEFAGAVNVKLYEGYHLHGGMNAVQRDGSIVYIQALAL